MLVRVRAISESFRDSLFFIPALFVLAAVAVAQLMLEVDERIALESVPSFLRFTVESARELLATVAGATVTVTGVVFALTAVSVQLASSQFSPRVVRGFLRDQAVQAGIGVMVATFTYSLMVLRAVRSPSSDGAPAVVPNLATGLALVLAVGMVLTILAYVNHTAQSLQATQLIGKVSRGTVALVRRRSPPAEDGQREAEAPPQRALGAGRRLAAKKSGWVQQISDGTLLDGLPEDGVVQIDVRVGSFVHQGKRLGTVWAGEEGGEVDKQLEQAFAIGRMRTMQQDVAFGIRQLVDIALRALSPGVNDATTAYECIVHLGEVVYEILRRELPPTTVTGNEGRVVLRPHELSHADYVNRAFDQIRMNAASMPDLCVALLRTLGEVVTELENLGLAGRTGPLRRQARLVLAGAARSEALPEDLESVRRAALDAGFRDVGLEQAGAT